MGADKHFKPGSFYRIDDRTGFATRAERTKREWTGLIVSERVWEARHPQDFVKGVTDDQTVPFPRPRQANVFQGPLSFVITVSAGARAGSVTLDSVTGINSLDIIQVILDNGNYFTTTVAGPPNGLIVEFYPPLPSAVSAGNVVVDLTSMTGISGTISGTLLDYSVFENSMYHPGLST